MNTNRNLNDVKELYSEKKYQEVIDILKDSIILNKEDEVTSYRLLAYSNYFIRDYDNALTYFSLLENSDTTFSDLDYLRTGQAFYKQNNIAKATEYLVLAYDKGGDAIFDQEDDSYLKLVKKTSSFSNPKTVYLDSPQIKAQAKILLKNNWLKVMLLNLLNQIITLALTGVVLYPTLTEYLSSRKVNITPTTIIIALIAFFFSYLISGGFQSAILVFVKNNGDKIKTPLLLSFFNFKIIKLAIPYILLLIIQIVAMLINYTLGLLLSLPIICFLGQIDYTIYETVYENKPIKENIIKENYKLMYNHKARYLALMASFTGWVLLFGVLLSIVSSFSFVTFQLFIIIGLVIIIPLNTYIQTSYAIFYRNLTSDQFDVLAYTSSQVTGELQIKDNYPLLIDKLTSDLQDSYKITVKEEIDAILNKYHASLHNDITYYTKKDQKQIIISSAINNVKEELRRFDLEPGAIDQIEKFIKSVAYDYGFTE